MKNTYTFLLYFGIWLFSLCSSCFKLDIDQISKYRKGGIEINVYRDDSGNFYKHKPSKPFLLKELYYDDDVIYFDPLLTSDQLLISASVLWVLDNPTVIHLNLEKSSVILLNESNSSLSVEAIFSEKTISNINHKSHPDSDKLVDVDIQQTRDYDSNSLNVSVNQLHLSGNGLEKFVLRYYDLSSYRLNNLRNGPQNRFGFGGLTTRVIEDAVPGNYENNKNYYPLNIPNKEQLYGVCLYSYNNSPLVVELVYTYNKRLYIAFTHQKRYHRVLMPTINEPYYREKLFNRLNYYACMNGFKYIVDIMKSSDNVDDLYSIDNYCIGPNGVDRVRNNVKLKQESRTGDSKYKCYEHSGENSEEFYVDNLYCGDSIFQLQNLPKKINSIRVYRYRNNKPCLITIVDNNSLLYYKREGDKWKYFNTDENLPDINTKFNEKINKLMEEFDPDEDYQEKLIDYKWKKEPKLKITDQILKLLPDKVNIKVEGDKTYQISTLKHDKDELESKRLKRVQYDIYNYLEGKQKFFVNTRGNLESEIDVETRRFRALIAMYYDGRPIIEFQDDDVLIHKAIYVYDKYRNSMDVWVYTNSLYVYHFRNNYYKYDYRWELVSKEPVKLAYPDDSNENLKRYFEEIKKLNPTTNPEKSKKIIVNDNAINLMKHDEVTILTRSYFTEKIVTIKKDKSENTRSKKEVIIPEFRYSSFTIDSLSHSVVKYKNQTLLNLDESKYHFIKHIEYSVEGYELNIYIYTNTLYVFRFRKEQHDQQWKFMIVQPVMCLDKMVTEPLKPYFTKMNEINKLDFKVDIHEDVIDLLPLGAEIKTQKNRTYFINTIKQTLPSLINNEIKIRYFDVYYDFDDTYWDYDLEKYVKFINIRKEGHYDSEAEIIGNHGFDNLKYYAYDVYKFRTKGRSLFLVVEFFCIRGINNVYGYTNTLYEYHSTRHDDDGYGDWKTTKKPVEMVDKESLGEKGLRDLKKYYKLTMNIDDFNFV